LPQLLLACPLWLLYVFSGFFKPDLALFNQLDKPRVPRFDNSQSLVDGRGANPQFFARRSAALPSPFLRLSGMAATASSIMVASTKPEAAAEEVEEEVTVQPLSGGFGSGRSGATAIGAAPA